MRAARHPNGSVRSFLHPASLRLLHRQHWECVRMAAHALESFAFTKSKPRRHQASYHHWPSTIFSSDSLASRRHSPTLGQLLLVLSLHPSALKLGTTICCFVSPPNCNSACFSLLFLRVVAPISVLVRLTRCRTPQASLSLLAQVAARLRAVLRGAGPHVRMLDTARSQPWRPQGGAQTGRRWGGGS